MRPGRMAVRERFSRARQASRDRGVSFARIGPRVAEEGRAVPGLLLGCPRSGSRRFTCTRGPEPAKDEARATIVFCDPNELRKDRQGKPLSMDAADLAWIREQLAACCPNGTGIVVNMIFIGAMVHENLCRTAIDMWVLRLKSKPIGAGGNAAA